VSKGAGVLFLPFFKNRFHGVKNAGLINNGFPYGKGNFDGAIPCISTFFIFTA